MENMRVLKVQNGAHESSHIGNFCHVTKKLILNKCLNCIYFLSCLACIISL